jgi:uracil-DNA glycosylase
MRTRSALPLVARAGAHRQTQDYRALGATAARSVLQRSVTISQARSRPHVLDDGTVAFVTIHPSFLLRIKDEGDKEREQRKFIADLRRAKSHLSRL